MIWQTKKLGEVCTIRTGKKDVNQGNPNGKYPFFTCAREHTFSDEYSFDTEALLVAGNGDVGHVNYYKGKFEAYQRTYVLSNFKDVLPRFLFVYLDGFLKDTVSKQKLGNTMPYIKMGMLTEFELPLPPLSEQKRIVKILDEVFGGIEKARENTEKNLKNSQELFESYLQNIFANSGKDWEEKTLEELGKITSSKRIYKKEYAKNGVPFYRIKEIKELAHGKDITLELYITRDRYKEIKDVFGVPLVGDILMTAVGTIGEIYIVKNDDEFYFKDGNVLWFKDFNSVDSDFLKYVLTAFVENIKKLSNGSAYSALTIEKIEKHKIFIPKSLTDQKAIVKKLDALSGETKKLEAIFCRKIADLDELKKSVLKQAFSGEL